MSKLEVVERAPSLPFDIYARISQEGDRTEAEVAEQLTVYETACRQWADRHGLDVEEVFTETDVSGTTAVAERKLEDAVARVESGESAGILTPYVDRFGRDLIEGALAWRRISLAGGRLVCISDGIDSADPGSKTMFNMRMTFAEDYLDRIKAQFNERRVRAAERGVYLGGQPPVGYWKDWDDGGRMKPHPKLSKLIVEAFERRGRGDTFASIARWLRASGSEIEVPNPKHPRRRRPDEPDTVKPLARVTQNGLRNILSNPAYLGEAERTRKSGEPQEFDRCGKPKTTTTIPKAHARLLTVAQWEAAQAGGGPKFRNNGRWSSQVRLAGLVYCLNGHRLKTGGGGSHKHAVYTCTCEGCDRRATIDAAKLDTWIEGLLMDCAIAAEPRVAAVLEGDSRYALALDALTEAQRELDEYREHIKVSDVGAEAWKRDVQIRSAAVETARAALKATPKPQAERSVIPISEAVWQKTPIEERRRIVEATWARESHARLISKIVVRPVGQGKRVHVSERAELWLVGAEAVLDPASVKPPDLGIEIPTPEEQQALIAAEQAS